MPYYTHSAVRTLWGEAREIHGDSVGYRCTTHPTGAGYVPYYAGDYVDAIKNKKATTHLLVHETLGGMCPYSARRLRRLARDAAAGGCDATDYTLSSTACSFVPYYAQRISSAIVMNGAQGMLDAVSRARRSDQLRRPARA